MAAGGSASTAYKEVRNLPEANVNSVHPEVLNTFSPKIRRFMVQVGAHVEFARLGKDTYMQVTMPGSLWDDKELTKELSFSRVFSDEEILERYAKAVDRVLGISMTGFYDFSLSTHDFGFNQQFKNYHPANDEDTPATRKAFFAQKFAQCTIGTEKDPILCSYFDILEKRIQ